MRPTLFHRHVFLAAVFAILLSASDPAEAKIVRTPVNVSIVGSGTFTLDVNHDTKIDFTIVADIHTVWCAVLEFHIGDAGELTVTSATGAKVVGSGPYASALVKGAEIGPTQTFKRSTKTMTRYTTCGSFLGPWYGVSNRYLGLELQINGETHYGWAKLSVQPATACNPNCVPSLRTTLVGFAYETNPGQPISAGQTSDALEPEEDGPTAALPIENSDGAQASTANDGWPSPYAPRGGDI